MPLDQLSELVSFVAQDNYLFDCSLKENIRMGKPDASDEDVLAAARAACCDDFIGRLADGWTRLPARRANGVVGRRASAHLQSRAPS